jgi:D-aspartate ligase
MNNLNPAFVLGMFETGLAVGRSLGRRGIKVVGVDFKKDIGFYSRYICASICPHPLEEERAFVEFLIAKARAQNEKPVMFITSDDFLVVISKNRNTLQDYFLMNLPDPNIIHSVTDKYRQCELAEQARIAYPMTYLLRSIRELHDVKEELPYPVFVKARDVNVWRRSISSSTKGFVVNDGSELVLKCEPILGKGVTALAQEIVYGPDTNHFKICCYVSRKGEFLLVFTLQKIRQLPVAFGVGSTVKSVYFPELVEIGIRFFREIHYHGVGSAEFKLDQRDRKLKLIELNPRYWQQNALAEKCGMNFPVVDYMETTGQDPKPIYRFSRGMKWANIYMDLASFLEYRRQKQITVGAWLNSLKGVKVLSDYALDDPLPVLYESRFGRRVVRVPRYLMRKIRHGYN